MTDLRTLINRLDSINESPQTTQRLNKHLLNEGAWGTGIGAGLGGVLGGLPGAALGGFAGNWIGDKVSDLWGKKPKNADAKQPEPTSTTSADSKDEPAGPYQNTDIPAIGGSHSENEATPYAISAPDGFSPSSKAMSLARTQFAQDGSRNSVEFAFGSASGSIVYGLYINMDHKNNLPYIPDEIPLPNSWGKVQSSNQTISNEYGPLHISVNKGTGNGISLGSGTIPTVRVLTDQGMEYKGKDGKMHRGLSSLYYSGTADAWAKEQDSFLNWATSLHL